MAPPGAADLGSDTADSGSAFKGGESGGTWRSDVDAAAAPPLPTDDFGCGGGTLFGPLLLPAALMIPAPFALAYARIASTKPCRNSIRFGSSTNVPLALNRISSRRNWSASTLPRMATGCADSDFITRRIVSDSDFFPTTGGTDAMVVAAGVLSSIAVAEPVSPAPSDLLLLGACPVQLTPPVAAGLPSEAKKAFPFPFELLRKGRSRPVLPVASRSVRASAPSPAPPAVPPALEFGGAAPAPKLDTEIALDEAGACVEDIAVSADEQADPTSSADSKPLSFAPSSLMVPVPPDAPRSPDAGCTSPAEPAARCWKKLLLDDEDEEPPTVCVCCCATGPTPDDEEELVAPAAAFPFSVRTRFACCSPVSLSTQGYEDEEELLPLSPLAPGGSKLRSSASS
mmetsp:Transcript_6116/g.15124  ORF Transcript_6116/g.15124 Transcript_6116/m.15124 type:complete len:399 (-) Transcript_6116:3968-5164(-)